MLCPFCQRESLFAKNPDTGGLQCSLADCPGRDFEVPALYVRDYERHPPMALSIIGPTNHGKTMFIEGLLTQLEDHTDWDRFNTQWIDETNMAEVRQRLRELRGMGQVARATGVVFPRPQMLRLRNIPQIGGCTLLMYDTGGEAFRNSESIQDAGRYIRYSRAILWIVSLTDLQYKQELGDFITSYASAMDRMGTDPQSQSVIIALTKGDRLANPQSYPDTTLSFPELPAAAKEFLAQDNLNPGDSEAWRRLEQTDQALRDWLKHRESPIRNSINLILDTFKEVRFCILSAQGSEAVEERLEFEIQPRGILSPLFWLWRLGRPGYWLQRPDGTRELYPDLAMAIEAAPDHASITLDAGTIPLAQTVMISRPLLLIGQGADKTKIVSSAEKFSFGLKGNGIRFQGISFSRGGEGPGDLFRVNGGQVQFERCRISEARSGTQVPGIGIAMKGNADVTLIQSELTQNLPNAIRIVEGSVGAKLTLKNCQLSKNGTAVVIGSGGQALLVQCQLSEQTRTALELQGDGQLTAQGCQFRRNGKYAVKLDSTSTPAALLKLSDCHVEEHSERAIELAGQGLAILEQVRVRGTQQAGIRISEQAQLKMRGGELKQNQFGLVATGSAQVLIEGTLLENNLDSGLLLTGQTKAIALRCVVRKHTTAGFRVEGQSQLEVAENQFEDNRAGEINILPGASSQAYRPAATPAADSPPTVAPTPKKRGWW